MGNRNTQRHQPEESRPDRPEFLDEIKADFDARLARLAADPGAWATFIETVANFGARYTLGNQFLLLMQAEERQTDPVYFLPFGNKAGTTGWKAHGRWVRKGEKAFVVWAPVRRRPSEDEAQRREAEGHRVERDDHGRPVKQLVGFRLLPTFDLSQTDGEPFEVPTVQRARRVRPDGQTPQLLDGEDPTGVYDDVVKLIQKSGYEFDLAAPGSRFLGTANGVTLTEPGARQVLIRNDVSPAQRTKTAMHELAHIRCDHTNDVRLGENLHRGRMETEAESVAHLCCRALGLDTQTFSDAYVLGWADGDMDLVKDCAQTVLTVAKDILTDLTPSDATDTTPVPLPPPDEREGSPAAASTVST